MQISWFQGVPNIPKMSSYIFGNRCLSDFFFFHVLNNILTSLAYIPECPPVFPQFLYFILMYCLLLARLQMLWKSSFM